MVSAPARRDQVDFAVSLGVSVRRACALMEVSRSALRYVSTMPARDAELAGELTQISAKRAAYGYRFAWGVLTQQRGWRVNRKRVRRVWRLLGLHRRRKKHRKIRTGTARAFTPTGPNQVWAYDFTFDRCAKLRGGDPPSSGVGFDYQPGAGHLHGMGVVQLLDLLWHSHHRHPVPQGLVYAVEPGVSEEDMRALEYRELRHGLGENEVARRLRVP